jgi:hypothetical protein
MNLGTEEVPEVRKPGGQAARVGRVYWWPYVAPPGPAAVRHRKRTVRCSGLRPAFPWRHLNPRSREDGGADRNALCQPNR